MKTANMIYCLKKTMVLVDSVYVPHVWYMIYQPVSLKGLNSHYFHIIGDKLINPIPGWGFIGPHEIRIPSLKVGWPSHPQYKEFSDLWGPAAAFCFVLESGTPGGLESGKYIPALKLTWNPKIRDL